MAHPEPATHQAGSASSAHHDLLCSNVHHVVVSIEDFHQTSRQAMLFVNRQLVSDRQSARDAVSEVERRQYLPSQPVEGDSRSSENAQFVDEPGCDGDDQICLGEESGEAKPMCLRLVDMDGIEVATECREVEQVLFGKSSTSSEELVANS